MNRANETAQIGCKVIYSNPLQEEIIYVNEALSGIHGDEKKKIAMDIVAYKRKIYDELKDKCSANDIRVYLESKIPIYLRKVSFLKGYILEI